MSQCLSPGVLRKVYYTTGFELKIHHQVYGGATGKGVRHAPGSGDQTVAGGDHEPGDGQTQARRYNGDPLTETEFPTGPNALRLFIPNNDICGPAGFAAAASKRTHGAGVDGWPNSDHCRKRSVANDRIAADK